MKIKIEQVSTRPSPDAYHKDTHGITDTMLELDPQDRVLWVFQQDDMGGRPPRQYYGHTLTHTFAKRPDESDLREWLEKNQARLDAICEGHEIVWDGHNMVGKLTDQAQEIWWDVQEALDSEIEESDWHGWSADDWLNMTIDELVSVKMTDQELEVLAERLVKEAEEEHVVILDNVEDYLTQYRNSLAEAE